MNTSGLGVSSLEFMPLDIGPIDNCAWSNCVSRTPTIWERFRDILYPTLIYLGIAIIISFFITLGFYLVYKHRNDEQPRKHAIRRCWPRWIIIPLFPFILGGVLFLIVEFCQF